MNRNVKGLIAVAVFGGVAYLIYRWVKKGGVNKLLGDESIYPQKAIINADNTPLYAYDKNTKTYQTTPLTTLKKGDVIGNYFGNSFLGKFNNGQTFNAMVVYRPDESGVIVEKERVNLK